MKLHGVNVLGIGLDGETRCVHYATARDIIALKFRCCGEWFPCHKCHDLIADHLPELWPAAEFDAPAILCGACGYQLTIREYFDCRSACPSCGRAFNPACTQHYHFYFEAPAAS